MSKHKQDEWLVAQISSALDRARAEQRKSKEQFAALLGVKPSTAYKYLAGDMVPGGVILWRACKQFGLILDASGLHPAVQKRRVALEQEKQFELAFMNEALDSERLSVNVRRKKDSEYVQVRLRIKVAG